MKSDSTKATGVLDLFRVRLWEAALKEAQLTFDTLLYFRRRVRRPWSAALWAWILGALLIGCAHRPPSPQSAAWEPPWMSVVAIQRLELIDVGDPMGFLDYQWQLRPLCQGVAVGPRQVITVEHCLVDADGHRAKPGSRVYFVTARQWYTQAWSYTEGRLAETRDGLAWITSSETLEHFASMGPIRRFDDWSLISLHGGTGFQLGSVWIEKDEVRGVHIIPGDSGAPIFGLDGAVVGLMNECQTEHGGRDCVGLRGWLTPTISAPWF